MSLEELIRWNEEINRREYVRVFRDLLNRPIKAISLDGRVSEWEYDENGRLCACSID
jgi:YD repeat-containing protein